MILVGTMLKVVGHIEADFDADRIAYVGLAECGGRTIGTRDINGRGRKIGLTKEAYSAVVDCILYDLLAAEGVQAGEVDCRCVDCGGNQPGHDPTCSYMHELHGQEVGNGKE